MYRHWGSLQAVRPIGGVQVKLYSFLTMALEAVSVQLHTPAALYPRERAGTDCTRGWVGPRAGVDRCGKSCLPTGFHPRPSSTQPVAIPTTLPGPLYIYIYVCVYIYIYIFQESCGHEIKRQESWFELMKCKLIRDCDLP